MSALKDTNTCGCEFPEIRARWNFEGLKTKSASAYCRNCNAQWKYSFEENKFVRVEETTATPQEPPKKVAEDFYINRVTGMSFNFKEYAGKHPIHVREILEDE